MATVLHAADYGGSYAGNFIASLLALDNVLNEELGLRLVLVFFRHCKRAAMAGAGRG
jgi:hypothetical protein